MKNSDKRLKNLVYKGRPKGARNKTTQAIAELSRGLTFEDPIFVNGLRERLRAGKDPQMAILLTHYGYGKPDDKLKVDWMGLVININQDLKRRFD